MYRFPILNNVTIWDSLLLGQPDSGFDAWLVPGTCPRQFLDLNELIKNPWRGRVTGHWVRCRFHMDGNGFYREFTETVTRSIRLPDPLTC